ncbi:MAG: DUF805 domain-containing protein [Eubacterium sp.]|nr:DUF805 domain-containing protein [Eubacterium sp.]
MENIIYAMKELFKNYLNWRGRLSKTGYMWSWAGILAVNVCLIFIRKAVCSYDDLISEIMTYAIALWNIVVFFPILFATMRRYHDSGNAGWKALILSVLSPVCIAVGLFIGTFVVIAFVFAGGYMITAGADVKMSRLLGFVALSAFLLLTGIGFGILNLKYIFRPSDPQENKYGKVIPFDSQGVSDRI